MTAPVPRRLGPDAPAVSAIGFGGMPLSITGRPVEAEAVRVVHAVLDAGVTLLDTADVYCVDHDDIGHNECVVAKSLREWSGDRDAVIVATKAGLMRPQGRWENNGKPEHIAQACERSLRALGVDCIDLYQFHAPDPEVPFADSVGAFSMLREQGKVRWVGLSNVTVAQIEEADAIVPVQTVQNRLNPFFREAVDTGVVDYCAQHGIGFLAYSPVGGGRLNRKLPTHAAVQPIAERTGATPHAIVIAWVLAQGSSVIPIPAGRTVEHALDAVRAGAVGLSSDDLAAIDGAEFSRA